MSKKTIKRALIDSSLEKNSYQDVNDCYAFVDVCVSSGCFVYREEIDEKGNFSPIARGLEISEEAIRFDRLNARAPVLDNHRDGGSIHDMVGSVEKAWIEKNEGIPKLMAKLRISKISPKEKEVALKIKNRIINSVSVGADVYKEKDITEKGDQIERRMAIDWEPLEVSLVPIPADAIATIRSIEDSKKVVYSRDHQQTIEESRTMNEEDKKLLQKAAMEGDLPEDIAAALTRMLDMEHMTEEEEAEVTEAIEDVVEEVSDATAEKEEEDKEEMAEEDEEKKMEAEDKEKTEASRSVRSFIKLCRKYKNTNSPVSNRSLGAKVQVGEDHGRAYYLESRKKVADAISHRIGAPGLEEDKSNEFRHMSLTDMFKELLYRGGEKESRAWDKETVYDHLHQKKVIKRGNVGGPFMVTSDLANIFSDSVNKSVQQSYEYMRGAQTFDPFVKRVTVKDFKTQESVSLGEFGKLQKTPPGAPSPITPMSDDKETWKVESYTNIFRITRQGFINDDTGELESVLTSGASAADLESDLVYNQLNSGTVAGSTWYSAARKNLVTGAPLMGRNPYNGIREIFELLAKQTGLDVDTPLNLSFKYLVVPVNLYWGALQSQGTVDGMMVPTSNEEYNPFGGMYKIIREARLDNLSNTTYYGIAGEANVFRKFIVLGTLKKQGGGPKIKFQENFSDDVLSWKLTHDVGAKVLDYRMAVRVQA